jgi:glutamine synthetase
VDIFKMTPAEKDPAGIVSMPANLNEALDELKRNTIAQDTLGVHILEKYVEGKE